MSVYVTVALEGACVRRTVSGTVFAIPLGMAVGESLHKQTGKNVGSNVKQKGRALTIKSAKQVCEEETAGTARVHS